MRKAGLRVPTIFHAFSNQSGGFETIGFEIKDIYNAIEKQMWAGETDAEVELTFFSGLKSIDYGMFWKYSLDGEKRLQNLFWCDGTSRYDCSVFGNVLGFDAMYGRNKYKCPLVIFLGVDHHMRTVVFNYVILNNESEDSYVWLLRPFLEAMKGKPPKSVMTDGDLVIKSTVGIVFPGAHYRLCSWHLLRNATAKDKPGFSPGQCVNLRVKSCLTLTPSYSSRILKSESLPFSNPSPSSSHCRRPSVELLPSSVRQPLPPSVARIPSLFVLFLKCPTPALSFRELGPSVVFICSPSCGRRRPSQQRTLPRTPKFEVNCLTNLAVVSPPSCCSSSSCSPSRSTPVEVFSVELRLDRLDQ